MKTTQSHSKSLFDTDYICEALIPRNSYFRKFKKLVDPIINDDLFVDLYKHHTGRPPISPALLAKAMILQFQMNLSDRAMERACMFDIEVKFALGIQINERPFDHSSLGDFRERLVKSSKEKDIFDKVIETLVKKRFVNKSTPQRIDATHIAADIAIPNMVALVKKGTFQILKRLRKENHVLPKRIRSKIDFEAYQSRTIDDDGPGRFDLKKRADRLERVVEEANLLIKHLESQAIRTFVKKEIETLKVILSENIEINGDQRHQEMHPKKKPKNRIVSPIDIDARAGRKSKFKPFVGYKTNITQEEKNGFITNIQVMGGNRRDGDQTISLFDEQFKKFNIKPKKMVGDSAYGDGSVRKAYADRGSRIVAPFKQKNERTKAVFPKKAFKINWKKETLTCPKGIEAKPHHYDSEIGSRSFHFPMSECNRCPLQPQCTKAKEGRRTVRIYDWQEEIYESEEYNLTPAFKEDMKSRQQIEGKFAEMKVNHGLNRARYRGLKKVSLQCYLTAATVNIKRWMKLQYGHSMVI